MRKEREDGWRKGSLEHFGEKVRERNRLTPPHYLNMSVLIWAADKCDQLNQPEDDFGQLSVLSEWVFGQGQSGFCSAKIPAQMNDPC